MEPEPASDTRWVVEVVGMMSDGRTNRDEVRRFLGRQSVGVVTVSELPHVDIDIRVEVQLDPPSTLGELERDLGTARQMPRRPDDFHSGSRFAFQDLAPSSDYWIRVFAEVGRDDASKVTKIDIDRSPRP